MGALEALFRSPPVIITLIIIIVVVFGSSKLPGAAKSLGQSLRIFRNEVKEFRAESEDNDDSSKPQQALSGQSDAEKPASAPGQQGTADGAPSSKPSGTDS